MPCTPFTFTTIQARTLETVCYITRQTSYHAVLNLYRHLFTCKLSLGQNAMQSYYTYLYLCPCVHSSISNIFLLYPSLACQTQLLAHLLDIILHDCHDNNIYKPIIIYDVHAGRLMLRHKMYVVRTASPVPVTDHVHARVQFKYTKLIITCECTCIYMGYLFRDIPQVLIQDTLYYYQLVIHLVYICNESYYRHHRRLRKSSIGIEPILHMPLPRAIFRCTATSFSFPSSVASSTGAPEEP